MLGDLGKLIVAKGFKKLPKVQKIARSSHTGTIQLLLIVHRHCRLAKTFVSRSTERNNLFCKSSKSVECDSLNLLMWYIRYI